MAFLLAGLLTGVIGALLALPALRASGPYLAMITIAFAFIVQHGTIEWKTLTGGQNGLMGLVPPTLAGHPFGEREMAIFATVLAGLSFFIFQRLAASAWGRAMVAVRDSEIAARSIGLNPVAIKTAAFAISAVFAGLAGAIFAPLMMFVAPDCVPVLAVHSFPACGHRRRCGMGAGAGGGRGRDGDAARAFVEPRRIPTAVCRGLAAHRPLDGA